MDIPSDNTMLVLAVLLTSGGVLGQLARKFRLPSVTGQILAGVLLGPSVLHVLDHGAVDSLRHVIHFALSLIAMDVGTHLHFRRLRNAWRRLGALLLLEATLTPLLVYVGLVYGVGRDWTFGILFGALAISTAPATVLAIVKETRSRGVYVRTLVAAVALNNIACIALFELAHAMVTVTLDPAGSITTAGILMAPAVQLFGAVVLGGLVGLALVLGSKRIFQAEHLTTVSIIAIFLTTGLADYLGINNLMACLFMGVTMVNLAPRKEEIGHRVFVSFQPAILAIFFTLAGLEMDFGFLAQGWLLVLVLVGARFAGKVSASFLAMRMAGGTDNLRRYLGLGLIPQAGVAVGLLLDVQDNPVFGDKASLILAVGVASVAINEIVGPVLVRLAMAHAGEMGKDRARLIDFIHEENIITDFHAETKEEALGQLTDLMVSSHGLQIDRARFLEEVIRREREMSTSVGRGLAIPHGPIESGEQIFGVMGVSREGLPFETPDGLPLRCVVLLASPPSQRQRQRDVQAMLVRAIGADWGLQLQLYNASSPAHVYEILHAEEFEGFNYFLSESPAV